MDGVDIMFFIMSHTGISLPCIPLPAWISEETIGVYAPNIWDRADFYAFDEAHLFEEGIVGICEQLRGLGKEVIVSGRDLDCNECPSWFMPILSNKARGGLHHMRGACNTDEKNRGRRELPNALDGPSLRERPPSLLDNSFLSLFLPSPQGLSYKDEEHLGETPIFFLR